jgi:hypothetical protein
VYTIMEQAGRIFSQNLLQLGMDSLGLKYPHTEFHLLQPSRDATLLCGPSMGFEASRVALRFGYTSTRAWLDAQGAPLVRSLTLASPVAGPRPPSVCARARSLAIATGGLQADDA